MRDGEKVALLRELLRRVQARADRKHFEADGGPVADATSPSDPWTPLNDDAVEVLSGRILGTLQTIPPPRPDDSGLIERWTELLEQDPGLVSALTSASSADVAEDLPSSDAIVPLPSGAAPALLVVAEPSVVAAPPSGPFATTQEAPKTAPPGHFESSVSAAIEALDEPSLLRSAETDLRVRRSARPILPRVRRPRSTTPVDVRRSSPARASAAASSTGPGAERGVLDEVAPAGGELVGAPEAGSGGERGVLDEVAPARSARAGFRWLGALGGVALGGVALGAVALSSLGHRPAPTSNEPPEVRESASAVARSAASTSSGGAPVARRPSAAPSASAPASAPRSALTPLRDPATFGWLRVDASAPGRVYVQGIDVGPTGVALEVRCGLRNVRVAQATPPPPGSSFPAWHGESKSVVVPCGGEHHATW